MYEESLAIQREIGNRNGAGVALFNIGDILREDGDLARAKRMYEESLAIGRETGDKSRMARALNGLGEVFCDQGDLEGARKSLEEALAIRTQLGEKRNIARSQFFLASLAVEEGRPSEGELLAQKAVEELRAEHAADAEAEARAVLAQSLFAQNQQGKAQEAIAPAIELARKSQDREVRFSVNIISARVRATLGKHTEAGTSLEATLAEAKKYGFVGYQLQARLALGEIEMRSGKTTAGHVHLAALEKDATAKGFLLVARKAVAASK